MKPLRPYQTEARNIIVKHYDNVENYFILADEGGLGKTRTGLEIAKTLDIKRVLLICPAMLRPNWANEITKWLPPKEERNFTIRLETYSSLSNIPHARFIYSQKFDLIILDEGHYLKSFDALRTKIILGEPGSGRKIISRSRYVLDLTATPTPNRVGEIYPFLWAVKSEMIKGMTQDEFIKLHAKSYNVTKFGLTHSGVRDGANFLRNQKFFLRRTIDEVEKDIPPGTDIEIPLAFSGKMEKEETEIMRELLAELDLPDIDFLFDNPEAFEANFNTLPGFVRYSEFRKRQSFLKVKMVADHIIESVLPEHKKFILLTYHKDAASKYFELLKEHIKKPDKITLIDDSVKVENRVPIINAADQDENHILISTIGKIREGANAINFRHMFFADLDWRWYVIKQATYRIRRIGSTKPMFYYFFPFEKGMDQKILKAYKEKKETMKDIYG